MSAPRPAVPKYATRAIAAVMIYIIVWGAAGVTLRGFPLAATSSFLLLSVAFLLACARVRARRVTAVLAVTLALVAISTELAAGSGELPISDAWSTTAVACIALLLLWRREDVTAWAALLGLAALLWGVGGFEQMEDAGVLPTALAVGVVAYAGRVLAWYSEQMTQYADTEREALEWRIAQDAYQTAHQQRIEKTGLLASAMLQQIVLHDGRLDQADRNECRLLHQAIRDETRGRLLLNDAVREQVRLHRRRGANVQLLDDGRLNHLEPEALARLHDDIARAITPLTSDRIVVRSGAKRTTGTEVVTIVATTIDPVAAALGLEDDEKVDLWCELEVSTRQAILALAG